MRKHILSLVTALAMCLCLTAPAAAAGTIPFHDVPEVFQESVAWALERGITNGTSATTFGSSNPCTHNHILTFIWRANGSPAAEGSGDFAKAVSWAKAQGIAPANVNGNAPCTRAQAMVYLWKAAGSPTKELGNGMFADLDYGADYIQAVDWAIGKLILT